MDERETERKRNERRSTSLQIYSRLCGTFWRCGRTAAVEGGKARRIPRERGSLLSRSSSRRRTFHPLCVYVYTRPESARAEGRTSTGYGEGGKWVARGRPRDEALLGTDSGTGRTGNAKGSSCSGTTVANKCPACVASFLPSFRSSLLPFVHPLFLSLPPYPLIPSTSLPSNDGILI